LGEKAYPGGAEGQGGKEQGQGQGRTLDLSFDEFEYILASD
jgi:hypothetical protein